MTLLKHSNVEDGVKWWFLYELRRNGLDMNAAAEEGLAALRRTGAARFFKRFGSEEELEIEAAVKYGVSPVDIDRKARSII